MINVDLWLSVGMLFISFITKRIVSESGDPPRSRRQNERHIKKDLGNKDCSGSSDR